MKESEALLRKEACIKRELKRAKRTALSPKDFETGIRKDSDVDDSACDHIVMGQDSETALGTSIEASVGLTMIHHNLSAMSQALAKHAKESTLRTEPGRHSFYVDAAVPRDDETTGIAVGAQNGPTVFGGPPLWTAQGYRLLEALDQEDAKALGHLARTAFDFLEKAHADRAKVKPRDPCSVAVVYADCSCALQRIAMGGPRGGKVVQRIID